MPHGHIIHALSHGCPNYTYRVTVCWLQLYVIGENQKAGGILLASGMKKVLKDFQVSIFEQHFCLLNGTVELCHPEPWLSQIIPCYFEMKPTSPGFVFY